MEKSKDLVRDAARMERLKAEEKRQDELDPVDEKFLDLPNPLDPHGFLSVVDDFVEQMDGGDSEPTPGIGR